jgi:hypothetical protein
MRNKKPPDPLDRLTGRNIRLYWIKSGLSQDGLGASIAVSFRTMPASCQNRRGSAGAARVTLRPRAKLARNVSGPSQRTKGTQTALFFA